MAEKAAKDEFRRLVIEHGSDLPPQQRTIAEYILDNLQTVPFLSIPELARRIGVSEATVVRFAQRIGYAGFAELKMKLVDMLQSHLDTGDHAPEVIVEDVLSSVSVLEGSNIGRTVEAIDRATFQEVAQGLFDADHVYTFGMGVSAHLAELAAYSLLQVGVRASHMSTRFSSPHEQLVAVTPSDLVLVFSLPPYSRQTLDILEATSAIDVASVAITDRVTSPAANLARWVLPVRCDNMMFTNAVASLTVLINALATVFDTSHPDHALEVLARINRALAEDDYTLDSL